MRNLPLLAIIGLGGAAVSMMSGYLIADYATAGIAAPYLAREVAAAPSVSAADDWSLPPAATASVARPAGDDGFDDRLLASR